MADKEDMELERTALHAWHVDNGGKMVPFAGFEMPVQYATGIIGEHLATRRGAGLFDVSHMGRFKITGDGAEAFLLEVLSNDARKLEPGQAQYTFIANPEGGAVDDAYLYRLAKDDYLLVVNASNRNKDWEWISRYIRPGVHLVDHSERMGLIALQGPTANELLGQIFPAQTLPEDRRNRLATLTLEGGPVVVARTGYTGESVCFELFPDREQSLSLWQRLVGLGATPVGLGARDSLRLEAGLPLYGHELGADPGGNDIPIFSNSLARFAVRPSDGGAFVGSDALNKQRAEIVRIGEGKPPESADEPIMTHVIQPIAAFGSRRPLRAGYQIAHQGQPVGYVTSGTVVPVDRAPDPTSASPAAGEHGLRPIGLAMIDRSIRYRTDPPLVLEATDARGNCIEVELVKRNLRP